MKYNKESEISKENLWKAIKVIGELPVSEIWVEFHGGEPLLKFDIIYETILKFSHIRKFKWAIQSNGTLINNEMISFVKKYNIKMGLSLDGNERIHNKNRIFLDGKGTWGKVMSSIQLLRAANIPFTIISVIENPENYYTIFDFFKKYNILNVSFNLLYTPRLLNDTILWKQYLRKIGILYFQMLLKMRSCKWEIIEKNSIMLLKKTINGTPYISCPPPSICKAGEYFFTLTPDCILLPCIEIESFYQDGIKILNYDGGVPLFKEMEKMEIKIGDYKRKLIKNIKTIMNCKKCSIKRFCAYGCIGIIEKFQDKGILCELYKSFYYNLFNFIYHHGKN